MLTIIVAINNKRVIGKEGWMPWHMPEDLAFFRSQTINHKVVFGRTTFNGFKNLLPKRITCVVTSKDDLDQNEKIQVIHDFNAFLEANRDSEEEIFIAGGANIYRQALPYCQRMLISQIDNDVDGDTWFPDFDEALFTKIMFQMFEGFKVYEYIRKDNQQ